MSELLGATFVEHRISNLPPSLIPETWGLERTGVFYQLDLKMCQIKSLDYSFHWGDESAPPPRISSVLDTPSKIVRLDVSLNELSRIPHDGLAPFRNLRALDLSLNQLKSFHGVEVLRHLYYLNLSHNNIQRVEGLLNSHSLGELNLSNNFITDISSIPSLINLRTLNLNNNKLQNLDGASSFPRLEEVYLNHNELTELVPLTSCLQLRVVSASNNHIKSLDAVLRLITRLQHLQSLNLSGNPVERDRSYQSDILRAGTIMTLDNVSVRPLPSLSEEQKRHTGHLYNLRDAAKQAFEDRLTMARERRDENVNFLQRRIISVQNEYREFEQKLRTDLEACTRYLDTLSEVELSNFSGDPLTTHRDQEASHRSYRPRDPKADYSGIKQTDEVLRCAFQELVKQRDKNADV